VPERAAGEGGTTDGLVVVDKPAGWTSHDVVARLRRIYGLRRVGHAGTLDPDATGVLLVGLGRATRLLRFLTETGKVYRGEVAFGVATDTLDAAGTETARRPMPALSGDDLAGVLPRFLGTIAQVPPMVSAIKVEGRRLHERARAGEVVERAPRMVRIDRIEVEAFTPGEFPRAQLLVACGSGTYIRSLAADLGEAAGGYAHLAWLRRLQVGPFSVEEARTVDEIAESPAKVVLPLVEAVRHLPRVDVDGETARGVAHGAVFPVTALGGDEGGPFAVVGPDGTLLALYQKGRAAARPVVVLTGAGAGGGTGAPPRRAG
jgi:tRNA pseudouridine55 synthase